MIKNDKELAKIVHRVGEDLQAIQNYLGKTKNPIGKVRFPHGFIRSASEIRHQLPSIRDDNLLRNISYAIMTTHVFRWLVIRTDLKGTAKEMIIKESICVLGSVCESLTKNLLKGIVGKKENYKARTKKLVQMRIINNKLKADLDWVWDVRNNEHLFLVEQPEYERYKVEDYNRAYEAYSSLKDALKNHFG
jgi:hypothetical protein